MKRICGTSTDSTGSGGEEEEEEEDDDDDDDDDDDVDSIVISKGIKVDKNQIFLKLIPDF